MPASWDSENQHSTQLDWSGGLTKFISLALYFLISYCIAYSHTILV